LDSDSEIRDSSDKESADLELLESSFDPSYAPIGNLARLVSAGFVFFLVAKSVHAVFPQLSPRNLLYIGFAPVAALATLVEATSLFHRVPELGLSKDSFVCRVLAQSLGFTSCVAFCFAGLGTVLSLGVLAVVLAVLILLCGVCDVISRRASEPPLSMNLK
jgi:hypothetical protein